MIADRGSRRTAAVLAIGALAAAIGIAAYAADLFRDAELDSVDARYSIRGAHEPRDDIVVVAIDDITFSELNQQWPFPRSQHAAVVRALDAAGADVIAYDVQFTEPTEPAQDNALIRAVTDADRVVLATTEVDAEGNSRIFGGGEALELSGARAGNALTDPDDDGVLRRFPIAVQGLEAFAVATAEEASGDRLRPPALTDGGAWIDYAGPPGSIPTASFSDVLNGEVDPTLFQGKTVVVGAAAPTLQDVHPVPIGGSRMMSGPEVQANAISTVLDGFPLDPAPGWLAVVVIGLMGLVVPVAGLRIPPLAAFLLALTLAALYLVGAQLAFDGGLIVPVVYPLLALAIGAVGTLALHYALAAVDRQRVRDTFARFVPANVVDEVLARAGEGLRLGGVRRECTVLFSDIRGFTTFAESRPPDEVVAVLNEYLREMTDAIMDHGGTLVSYLGDGIIAVFGAPIEQDDHADRALAAAREMIDRRLPRFREWMGRAGHGEGFRIGIGLNSGEVMSGQVGSERRMEYTTIGDTVNTAARLEGMTKGTEHQLFLAESTREALVAEASDLVPVGELAVRGRAAPIRVWSLADDSGAAAERAPVPAARDDPG